MIKRKRKKLKLSQAKLAKKIGVSRGYISRLERREKNFHPSTDIIILLSNELGICPLELFAYFTGIKCYIKKGEDYESCNIHKEVRIQRK
jgi:transcriptional regulator with XRE-family HTH domain